LGGGQDGQPYEVGEFGGFAGFVPLCIIGPAVGDLLTTAELDYAAATLSW
jgi:hypothetical protein